MKWKSTTDYVLFRDAKDADWEEPRYCWVFKTSVSMKCIIFLSISTTDYLHKLNWDNFMITFLT